LKDLEELKLQWLTFNVKTFDLWGGWISEKFQSLSRIALWIYGGLMVVDNVPPFVEPKGCTVDLWYKEDYMKWLKVRGEPTEGDKDLLKESVMNFLKLPVDQQPQFLPMECSSADGMMRMLRYMVVMFTALMQLAIEVEKHAKMIALHMPFFECCGSV
jgi:hypothetical protein